MFRDIKVPIFGHFTKCLVFFRSIQIAKEDLCDMKRSYEGKVEDNPYHFTNARFVGKHEAMKELGISETTLKIWRNGIRSKRQEPVLRKGVHWCKPIGSKTAGVLYNVSLIKDWMCSPDTHEQAVEAFLKTMPSSIAAALR